MSQFPHMWSSKQISVTFRSCFPKKKWLYRCTVWMYLPPLANISVTHTNQSKQCGWGTVCNSRKAAMFFLCLKDSKENRKGSKLWFHKKVWLPVLGYSYRNKQSGWGLLLPTWLQWGTDLMPLNGVRNVSVGASSCLWNNYRMRTISKQELGHDFTWELPKNMFSGCCPS